MLFLEIFFILLRQTTGVSVSDIVSSCFIAVSSQVCLHVNHSSHMTNKHKLQENKNRKRFYVVYCVCGLVAWESTSVWRGQLDSWTICFSLQLVRSINVRLWCFCGYNTSCCPQDELLWSGFTTGRSQNLSWKPKQETRWEDKFLFSAAVKLLTDEGMRRGRTDRSGYWWGRKKNIMGSFSPFTPTLSWLSECWGSLNCGTLFWLEDSDLENSDGPDLT